MDEGQQYTENDANNPNIDLPEDLHDPSPMSTDENARTWAMVCHLITLAGHIMPFGHIIGPLIVWLLKRTEHPFIDFNGKESLNFQISMTIYSILAGILIVTVIGACIGGPALFALWITDLACVIIAAVKANNGETFTYPISIRFIK
jgi:uncharacterized Tic20 family protein